MNENTPGLGWGHININVRDLERSIRFYEKLGFEVFLPGIPYLSLDRDAPPKPLAAGMADALGVVDAARGRACIMQLGDGFPKIDLTEFTGVDQAPPLANTDLGLVRLCLTSGDLEADVAGLKSEGVQFLSDPRPSPHGLADVAVCRDPDGTLIELIQVYLERWEPFPGGHQVGTEDL